MDPQKAERSVLKVSTCNHQNPTHIDVLWEKDGRHDIAYLLILQILLSLFDEAHRDDSEQNIDKDDEKSN